MDQILYQKGQILVTQRLFKTARRSYKIHYIERIHLKRPWFFFGLPISIGSYLLLNNYKEYLYQEEIILCLLMMLVLPVILYFIGTLSITSKSYTNDNAVTGFMPTLKRTRHALEEVLYEQDYSHPIN